MAKKTHIGGRNYACELERNLRKLQKQKDMRSLVSIHRMKRTVRAVIGAAEELNTPIIIDHAQVHDSLIPIERIGPVMLKYAKEARVPGCAFIWIMEVIMNLL